MILEALVNYYEDLVSRGEIAPLGWAKSKISYGLHIDETGKLKAVTSFLVQEEGAKKPHPEWMNLPAPVARTQKITSNFLWDNAKYLLGIGPKNDVRDIQCFLAAKELHETLLDKLDNEQAKSIVAFFRSWDVEAARENELLQPYIKEFEAGCNILLCPNGKYPHEDESLRNVWDVHYRSTTSAGHEKGICLVTGKEDYLADSHPLVKGVYGGQSSGTRLVSFNAPSLCSYGKESGGNAPVGEYAAFAYTQALNYLLADKKSHYLLGNDTVVFWAPGGDPSYAEFAGSVLFGANAAQNEGAGEGEPALLYEMIHALAKGKQIPELKLDPSKTFYVLGLSPAAARISVKYFYKDSFGNLMKHIEEHNERLEIERPSYDPRASLSIWSLLSETVPQKKLSQVSPTLQQELTRAVFTGGRYPSSLIAQTMRRVYVERDVSRGKAAIIKAYYLRNQSPSCPEEVLTMSLNEDTNNTAYVLGRLFRFYEDIQFSALGDVNRSVKDKHFSSAAKMPAAVFPTLERLSRAHLKKLKRLNYPKMVWYERQLTELMGRLEGGYPARLSPAEQAVFSLGYYHQTQEHFRKKPVEGEVTREKG